MATAEIYSSTISKGPLFGVRYVQTFLLFVSIIVTYFGRVNVGVALVAMTNADTTNPNFQEFDWNPAQKSYILSSFYWGYVITQFPGGVLSKRYGAKFVLLVSILGSSIFSLITPVCVSAGGWQVFCFIRIMQGLFQGMIFPAVHVHIAKWSPEQEVTRLGSFANSGMECGTILAMFVSGIIAASDLGWPGISYIAGAIGVVWCATWIIFGANSPASSKFISADERKYIQSNQDLSKEEKKLPTPWKAIFTSIPFLAMLVVRCAQSWGYNTLQAQIPSYMNGVLQMEIKGNALFSALPYMASWVGSYICLILADVILDRKWMSLTAIRKVFTSVAFFIPAAALIGVGYVDENQKALAISLMTANVGINSANTVGAAYNTVDLSPNHAGMLMAVVNTVGNVIPIITPLVVGLIVIDESDRTQWQIVFAISAAIFIVGGLIFDFFGSAETQRWNNLSLLVDDKEAYGGVDNPQIVADDLPTISRSPASSLGANTNEKNSAVTELKL